MQGDFITRIKSAYNQLTKAEKKVADYILANPKAVLFMSITDLAEACEVGDTSVFRFCKTMELKGYQEFKMMLSLSIGENQDEMDQFTGNNISVEDSFNAEHKYQCIDGNLFPDSGGKDGPGDPHALRSQENLLLRRGGKYADCDEGDE